MQSFFQKIHALTDLARDFYESTYNGVLEQGRVAMQARWDIFCTVVDNYGDIGVTWRLARQLAAEYPVCVRLWVDDLAAFAAICPAADAGLDVQVQQQVEVRRWPQQWQNPSLPDVLIEAFGCTLPDALVAQMGAAEQKPLWLNLEYLSAESWVTGCHGLPSPQGRGLNKFFFFPGFVAGTGGLLRERQVLAQRQAFQADAAAQQAFLRRLGVRPKAGAQRISLFAYEKPDLAQWLQVLAQSAQATQLLVPVGRVLADVERALGEVGLAAGDVRCLGSLEVTVLPFVSQQDYDRLLWCCDFNAIRGEDSFVRAQWAGRPFVWHIYKQEHSAHLEKLEAFMALYQRSMSEPVAEAFSRFWQAWNTEQGSAEAWLALQPYRAALQQQAENWCVEQSLQPDLAQALVQFYQNWLSCAA